MNKNKTTKEGWDNRNLIAIPNKECIINIIHKDIDGENEYLCRWKPFNKSEYGSANMPGDGYLGTATVIKPPFEGIGFHAWEQNNSEFIYYKISEHPQPEEQVKEVDMDFDLYPGNEAGAFDHLDEPDYPPSVKEVDILEENKRLKEVTKLLVDALQPFAKLAYECLNNSNLNKNQDVYAYNNATITMGNLRDVEIALKEANK